MKKMSVPFEWKGGFSDEMREKMRLSLDELNTMTEETKTSYSRMSHIQDKYILNYETLKRTPGDLSELSNDNLTAADRERLNMKQTMRNQLCQSFRHILELRRVLTKKRLTSLAAIDGAQRLVGDAIQEFQRKQQLANNGAPFDHQMIDELSQWCESLAEIILTNRLQIINESYLRQKLKVDGCGDELQNLLTRINAHLSTLIKSTFLVEDQPVQVLKKDTRFKATVRLLIGGKLNLQFDPPRVKAVLISEQQARDVLDGRAVQTECGDILNGEAPMEFHSGKLNVKLWAMKLRSDKRIKVEMDDTDEMGEMDGANGKSRRKRKESSKESKCFKRPPGQRRTGESVLEEKLCIHSTSKVKLNLQQPLEVPVSVFSLPLIVTVHGNQNWKSEATILWDNQFAEPGRIPFNVRTSTPWPDFAYMLSMRFYGWTGQCLDMRSLEYIKSKLVGADENGSEISWTKFSKGEVRNGNHTFWEWFWTIGKLVKEKLAQIWKNGLIVGFIDKSEIVSEMLSKPVGTFLLRFSERVLGGLTIAYVKEDMQGNKYIDHISPFTMKDLEMRGLADRIRDIDEVQYLYPDFPKHEKFGEFYRDNTENDGHGMYTPHKLVTVLEKTQFQSTMDTCNMNSPFGCQSRGSPVTPTCFSQQSPCTPQDFDQSSSPPRFAQSSMVAQNLTFPRMQTFTEMLQQSTEAANQSNQSSMEDDVDIIAANQSNQSSMEDDVDIMTPHLECLDLDLVNEVLENDGITAD